MKNLPTCPRESDVLELVSIGQWPGRADQSLRDHVAGCDVCADLAIAAAAIVELRDADGQPVGVPDASVVWYRAQIHARLDAARRAARPLRLAQAVGAVCFIAVGLAWWSAGTSWLGGWWQRLPGLTLPRPEFLRFDGAWADAGPMLGIAALVLVAWMVLIPFAWYLADLADDN